MKLTAISRRPFAALLCTLGMLAATAATADPAAADPGSTIPGTGTYLVGKDVKAGVYRSTGNDYCYWQRSKDASGTLDSIIANDIGTGRRLVYVKTTDKVFTSNDCRTWTRLSDATLRAKSTATTIPGNGWFLVGAEFVPGTYRSSGNTESCYWARARSADGELSSIIINEISTGQLVVTINATDVVFHTSGCTTWTRIS
jgi:hypothetical protein